MFDSTADLQGFRSELPILIIDNFNGGRFPTPAGIKRIAGIRQVPRQSAALMVFEPQSATRRLHENCRTWNRGGNSCSRCLLFVVHRTRLFARDVGR